MTDTYDDDTEALIMQACEELGVTVVSLTRLPSRRIALSVKRADGTDGGLSIAPETPYKVLIDLIRGESASAQSAQASRDKRIKAHEDEIKAEKGE